MDSQGASRGIDWRWIGLRLYVTVNLFLIVLFRPWEYVDRFDWQQWRELPAAIAGGYLYSLPGDLPYVYSPLAAPLLAGIGYIGAAWWVALNAAALLLLRDRLIIALAVVSWGFWTNALVGNTFVFVFVAGALAYWGSRRAALVFLALTLLMPRPVQAPLALWLLWAMPEVRWPFAAMLVFHTAAVVATGYAGDWVMASLAFAGSGRFDVGPTLALGPAWLLVGVPLGIWLTVRGHVGWAGIAISPYVLQHYYLMPLIEIRQGVAKRLGNRAEPAAGAVNSARAAQNGQQRR